MDHKFSSPKDITNFITAGDATFTLESTRTGKHLTYKVSKIDGAEDKFFVGLLTGPDNTSSYTYIGMIVPNVLEFPVVGARAVVRSSIGYKFLLTKKSRLSDGSEPVKAIRYALDALNINQMPKGVNVYHVGRCGKCGRVLTVPESIDRGIGPDCWSRM